MLVVMVSPLSHVSVLCDTMGCSLLAPLSMSGLPFPYPGDLPDLGSKPRLLH